MPRCTLAAVSLTAEEKAELEVLVRARSTPQQVALRARMVLLAAAGMDVNETAHRLNVWAKTVRRWRGRWLAGDGGTTVWERLSDLPRSGAPAKFTAEQLCAIVALACEPPESAGVPITHWSQSELAREAIRRSLVETISQRSVGRVLKRIRPETASGAFLVDREARS